MKENAQYEPFEATAKLPNGRTLLIQQNYNPAYSGEIFIGIGDRDGVWTQDLAAVGEAYQYNKDGTLKWLPDVYMVDVWANPETDEPTSHNIISERKEWDEQP